jgi:hypothetical protein
VNTRPARSTSLEIETLVVFEGPKVAVSVMPLGTVAGVQLLAVFQSLDAGFNFQVALPAWTWTLKERLRRIASLVLTDVLLRLVQLRNYG